jgi:response regulator RpfG family c-di-GMP phosphodiesterase
MTQAQLIQLEQQSQQQTDYYAEHLSELDEVNPVVFTEDIITTKNIPLVKKGARLTKNIAQQILQHKLIKPLEHQIQIESCINGETLLKKLNQLMEKFPDLRKVHDNSGHKQDIENLIKQYVLPPLLAQKLTVLLHRLPSEFEKTLFCTWLAVNIALTAKLNNQTVETTYVAGLAHDIGMLHISPHIFTKQGQLNAEEWRAIQSHVVISYLFLKSIGGHYIDSARAILEHHERCDGTGYPLGKTTEQLSIAGQIIAIADTLQAIRVNQLEKTGRNLSDTIPFLQMNATTYMEQISRATTTLLKRAQFEIVPNDHFDTIEKRIDHLLISGDNLDKAVIILRMLVYFSDELTLGQAGREMLRVIKPVSEMIRRSGIIEDHIFSWLQESLTACDQQCLLELCEMELMQNELFFQLKKARHSYINFLEQEPEASSPEDMRHFTKLAAMIEDFL